MGLLVTMVGSHSYDPVIHSDRDAHLGNVPPWETEQSILLALRGLMPDEELPFQVKVRVNPLGGSI